MLLLLCTQLQNGWRHDPRGFLLVCRTIVVPVGIIVQYTVNVCVQNLVCYVIIIIVIATAVDLSVLEKLKLCDLSVEWVLCKKLLGMF